MTEVYITSFGNLEPPQAVSFHTSLDLDVEDEALPPPETMQPSVEGLNQTMDAE